MSFESWQQFWDMGGYAAFVWSSYGIAAAVLMANVIVPVVAHRRLKRRIRNEEFDD